MSQGTKHPGGRPRQGLTRKVSITLTETEWSRINNSGKTVAAFLKDLMNNEFHPASEPTTHTLKKIR